MSDSSVFRRLMRFVFMAHADETLLASDAEEAREYLTSSGPLDLVICDVGPTPDVGLELLEAVAEMSEPRPAVVVVATHTNEADRSAALARGARGYLGKPISYHDIIAALKQSVGADSPRAPRRRHGGPAYVLSIDDVVESQQVESEQVEPEQGQPSQLHLRARDVSATGAFLETDSPLPIGARVQLALDVAGTTVHVRGRVVRVQEPSWGLSGGVGVAFLDDDPSIAKELGRFVAGDDSDIHH